MLRDSVAWKTLLATFDRHAGAEFKLPLNEPSLRNSVGHLAKFDLTDMAPNRSLMASLSS